MRARGGVMAALLIGWCALGMAVATGGEMISRFEFSANGSDVKSYGYVPMYLDIDNDVAQRLLISIRTNDIGSVNYSFRQSVELPDSTRVRLEVPVPRAGGLYAVEVKRERGSSLTDSINYPGIAYRSTPLMELWAVNAYQYAPLNDYVAKMGKGAGDLTVVSRSVEDLPTRWQSYAGVSAIPLIGVKDIRRLSAQQRRALTEWVRWGGGRLWLVGETDEEACEAAEKDFSLRLNGKELRSTVSTRWAMTGQLWTCSEKGLLEWDAKLLGFWNTPGMVPEFRTDSVAGFVGGGLLERLGGLSATAIALILVAMGVLLGPVNYLYIRRKSLLLFFVTTPLLALFGVAVVGAYSVFHEGFSVKYKEAALLMHETETEHGAVLLARGIYSGLGSGNLTYPAESLLYPFRQSEGTGGTFSADLGAQTVLTGGWVTPRTPSGILSVTPQAVRMGIRITREGDRYYAQNTLTHPVLRVTYQRPISHECGYVDRLAPGEKRELQMESSPRKRDKLCNQARNFFPKFDFGAFQIVAECEGLPYLDAGDPGGVKEEGTYYYVSDGTEMIDAHATSAKQKTEDGK